MTGYCRKCKYYQPTTSDERGYFGSFTDGGWCSKERRELTNAEFNEFVACEKFERKLPNNGEVIKL